MKRLLVTAALPYANGPLHVGHIAGAYLPADIYVRYQRLIGRDVRFICGSDDHGVPIMLSAEREERSPSAVADHYNEQQRRDFSGLKIEFDVYGSTSRNKYHAHRSQSIFLELYKRDFFEKRTTKQFYDAARETFLPDRYVTGTCGYCGATDQNGDQCENCGKILDTETLKDARSAVNGEPAEIRDTTHWFLDLSRFEGEVERWLERGDLRDHTRKFVTGLLSTGLVKRAMTRDLSWGIPVPIDDPDAAGKVLYVWFDAPIGYISNTEQLCGELDGDSERFVDWWKSEETEILHFIGEDNTIFHCVIWIAMLSAEGSYQLPKGVIVNQFLNFQRSEERGIEKMSKSRGVGAFIGDLLSDSPVSVDALRYYLTAVLPENARTVYQPEHLLQRNNSDLADTLGNFVNRIVSFTHKYCEGRIPAVSDDSLTDLDRGFAANRGALLSSVGERLDRYAFRDAQERVFEFARECNRYVDEKAPWKARESDPESMKRALFESLQAIWVMAVALAPFMPDSSAKMVEMVKGGAEEISWESGLAPLESGGTLGSPVILFEKVDL